MKPYNFILFIYLCVRRWVGACEHACAWVCPVETGGQSIELFSLIFLCESRGSDFSPQAWQQMPLPNEPAPCSSCLR